MKIGTYYILSPNEDTQHIDAYNREYLQQIAAALGQELPIVTAEEAKGCDYLIVLVGGGGTEASFRKALPQLPASFCLLATDRNNSLAASMEILSYLRQQGITSEILHGSAETVAKRLDLLSRVRKTKEKISHLRLGCVGRPSDWLISSDVDREKSKELNGITILDIPMEELMQEFEKHQYEDNEYTKAIKARGWHPEDTEVCCEIYGALKRIVQQYQLDGVTLRCFDLLGPLHNTGCLALAVLNAEGVYAGCEGDVPSLISMAILGELSGNPVFMANPSQILPEKNEIIFAHCTLPLNMPTKIELMTHYESGLGVAFRGTIPEGPCTVFKTSGLLNEYFVSCGELQENLCRNDLCRTQIRLQLPAEDLHYFLTRSIGNHHLITTGDHTELVKAFYQSLS
ncbi:MAG: hypothetical protein IKE21_04005 [Erysipelotrichaceae bacterium]|nr:hypothetical protein [Erysipelotrichaceae bacterium]